MRALTLVGVAIVAWQLSAFPTGLTAADTKPLGPDPQLYQTTVSRAVQFLAAGQLDDGSLSAQVGIGPTALTALGLLRSGRTADDPRAAKALKYLEEYTQESGGIHTPGSRISTYETCIALVCFHEANRDGQFDKVTWSRRRRSTRPTCRASRTASRRC